MLPCFKEESARMPIVMKITKGVQVLTWLKAYLVDLYSNNIIALNLLPFFKVKACDQVGLMLFLFWHFF